MEIPNSVSILHKTSLLTESLAFLESIVVPCAVPVRKVSRMLFQEGRSSNFS